jgi:hypothetical protein
MFGTLLTLTVTVSSSAVRLDTDAYDYDPLVPFTVTNNGTTPITLGRTASITAGAVGGANQGQQLDPGAFASFTLTADGLPVYGIAAISNAVIVTKQTADFSGAMPPSWQPSDDGLLAWTDDYSGIVSGMTPTAGTIYLVRHRLRRPATVTNVLWSAVGAATTPASLYGALYSVAGALLGVSAEFSATWAATTGLKTIPLAVPYAAAAGEYYSAFLIGSAGAVPTLAQMSTAVGVNANKTGLNSRFATGTTGLTAAPPGATTTATVMNNALWSALS